MFYGEAIIPKGMRGSQLSFKFTMCVYCKGGANMARMTVEEIYRGEKYDVMSAATADYLMNGLPAEYDERT